MDRSGINYISKQAVSIITFSKGGVVTLNAANGHDLEIISWICQANCDATVASRSLACEMFDAASGAGNKIHSFFSHTITASGSVTSLGGKNHAGTGSTGTLEISWNELIVPANGSLTIVEANFVAGDTWTMRTIYRDNPVDLMV